MKLENISKLRVITTLVFYLITILVGSNFYLGKINYKKNEDSDFYNKLKEIKYFAENKDPYLESTRLKIYPTNYFSIQKGSNDKLENETSVFSLNQYNFRKNSYNKFVDQKKKCIFFTGSSAAFGVGVTKDNKTIPSQLHKIIGDEYLIYNLAIPSWNSRQELISIFNTLYSLNKLNCKSIKSISFTGTADINNIYFSRQSKFFKTKEGRYKLMNAPEQYHALEKKLEKLTKVESSIKYNLRIIVSKIYKNLFGNLNVFFTKNKKDAIFGDKKFNSNDKEFIYMQSKAFFYNQFLINNLINDLGGNHIVFIQPDLRNFSSLDNNWNYINNSYTNQISKNNCLNIVDLRNFLNHDQKKYYINGEFVPLSLKEAIKEKLFKIEHMNSHFYYDDSHFTDNGSLKIAIAISNNIFNKGLLGGKCNLLKTEVSQQNK
tara:strand:- start:160 stop:1455 length:1296 start_codon:yes stop_codon:yes gene_type:complete